MILTLLIVAVVTAVIAVVRYREYGHVDWDGQAFGAMFMGGCFVAFLVFMLSIAFADDKTITTQTYLQSFERTSQVSGSFFLGSGTINGGPAYCYYVKVAKDTYALRWEDATRATIVEDGNTYVLKTQAVECEGSWWLWIQHHHAPMTVEFHIPKGSIKHVFKP